MNVTRSLNGFCDLAVSIKLSRRHHISTSSMGQSSSKMRAQPVAQANLEFSTTPHGLQMYGERKCACTVMFGNLDANLHKHLLDEIPAFTCAEDRMIELGFAKCIDYPLLPDHVYYEGYFHSCRNSTPIESINPRNGRPFNKPPAPKALRALYIAFRDKNKALLREMAQKILELPQAKPLNELEEGTPKVDARQIVAKMFNPDGSGDILCGDLAIQVHCGTGVSYEHIGWHRDAINSIFHFATSIRGKRELYSSLSDQPDNYNSKKQIFVDRLETPNIYISSPAFFRHAVSYPEQSWEDRTIAIQARFLLTRELLNTLKGTISNEDEIQVSYIIAEALCKGFELPSFQEVIEVETTLDDYKGSFKVDDNYLDGIKEHLY